jgi:hypothetical protein
MIAAFEQRLILSDRIFECRNPRWGNYLGFELTIPFNQWPHRRQVIKTIAEETDSETLVEKLRLSIGHLLTGKARNGKSHASTVTFRKITK